MATYAAWQATIVNERGDVVPNAKIEVRSEATGLLATLYSDRSGSTPAGNPMQADSNGFVRFFCVGGAYKVRVYTGPSGAPDFEQIWRYEAIGTAAEYDRDTFLNGGLSLSADVASFSTTNPTSFFQEYDLKGVLPIYFTNSENRSSFAAGSFRDALFVSHAVTDGSNYGNVQHVNYAVRGFVTGPFNAGTGVYGAVYQDLVGADFTAIGRVENSARGVSGITASAIQFGQGIASNEFHASNPSGAATQSLSMAAVQGIISGKKAAADVSHLADAFRATNLGKRATSAFGAQSAGTDGDSGHFNYLLDGSRALVDAAAIIMPGDGASINGTRIIYDTNDSTSFDRASNTYNWSIGAAGTLSLNAASLFSSVIAANLKNGLAASPSFGFASDDNTGMYRVAEDVLGFSTGGSLRFQIGATGGLTASAYGAGALSSDASGNISSGVLGVASGGTGASSFTAGRIPFGAGASALNTSASLFWDNTNGRLGVGLNSPSYKIHVSDTSGGAAYFALTDAAATLLLGANGGGQGILGTFSNFDMTFWSNSLERMRLTAAGSLVMGTAALATNATDGFLYIRGGAGAPTGTPTAFSGRVPLYYDTTNNNYYVYNSGWKKTTVFA